MKRKFCIAISVFLLFTGCGQQTELVETDAEIDVIEETETDENMVTETVKETTIVDEAEVKYQELLASYEGTPYEEAQELNYIPRPRQSFSFCFYDTVKEIEEIGRLGDGWDDGTYVVVHFENEENNLLMYDKSRQGGKEWNPYISAEFDEYMNVIEEQEKINSFANVLLGDSVPEIGTSDSFIKTVSIQNVVDTNIVYNNAHYYEVDNGNGLKNIVCVPVKYIPEPAYELYELGEYRENTYYNKEYNIKIESNRIDPRFSSAGKNCGVYTNWRYAMNAVNWHEGFSVDTENGSTYLSIDTYEFPTAVTEQEFNSVVEGLCQETGNCIEQGKDIIGGREYTRAADSNEVVWYRYEGNKVYSITSGLSYEETLSLILEFNE